MLTYLWVSLPVLGGIRVSTLIAAGLILVIASWRAGFLYAVITVLAWSSAYEILYAATATAIHHLSLSLLAWLTLALTGWVLLGWVANIRPERWQTLAFGVVWVGWILSGFHANEYNVTVHFDYVAEAFNVLTKTILATAYLTGTVLAARDNRLRSLELPKLRRGGDASARASASRP
jgi:glucan phosphoethanolaminetransferase (alkaline phosphatase superfamily)